LIVATRLTVPELRSADRKDGEEFEAILVLRKCSTRTARNESTFLAVELGDCGGTFTANVFSDNPASEMLRSANEGDVVWISGKVDHYQGRFSPRISQVRIVDEAEIESVGGVEALVETSPEDPATLADELTSHVGAIVDDILRRTVELSLEAVRDRFHTAPAAMAMHHAYRCGLLEHTVRAVRACRALLPLYPEVHADLALAGTILHDIGKAVEYAGSLAPAKTRAGQLQGHVVLGYRIVRRAAMVAKLPEETLERLEHVILSHQGELEWGAAVMAATPEAVFVSMIDNLDAKMGMVQRALRTGDEAEFSDYLPGLKAQILRHRPPPASAPPPEAPVTDA
jgi:3'-5' exoribonuclease